MTAVKDGGFPDEIKRSHSIIQRYRCTKIIAHASRSSTKGSPNYGGAFDLDQKEREIAELEAYTQSPGFWDDNVAAQKTMREINIRKEWVDSWTEVHTRAEDLKGLVEIAEEERDAGMEPDIE